MALLHHPNWIMRETIQMADEPKPNVNILISGIVASYVEFNKVAPGDMPALIAVVRDTLDGLTREGGAPVDRPLEPYVPVRRSITPDYLVCLEDGLRFKSLKSHLRTKYSMSPQDYRAKWGLPGSYPMVAPNYAKARSELAKRTGLGSRKRPVAEAVTAAPRRGSRQSEA